MKNKIPCGIIRDLLPSYIENLTGEESNKVIEEHMSECAECENLLSQMKGGEETSPSQFEEIDFLKKNRRKNRRVIIASVLCAVLILSLFIPLIAGITKRMNIRYDFYDFAKYEIDVDEETGTKGTITLSMLNDAEALNTKIFIRGMSLRKEEDRNKIYLDTDIGPALFKRELSKSAEFKSKEKISEIYLDDILVWKDGEVILPVTSNIYQSSHPYIGAMSENNDSAYRVGLNLFGGHENVLHTAQEPYSWDISFEMEVPPLREDFMKKYLTAAGYALIATIDNLDSITFKYTVTESFRTNSREEALTVSKEDASKLMGEDVKIVGKDILKLQDLLEKSGFIEYYSYTHLNLSDKYSENVKFIFVNDYADSQNIGYIAVNCLDKKGELVSCLYRSLDEDNTNECHNFLMLPMDFGLESFRNYEGCSIQFAYYGNEYTEDFGIHGVSSDPILLSEMENGTAFNIIGKPGEGLTIQNTK